MKIKDNLLKAAFSQDLVIVVIGQSGSGKGTLTESLIETYKRLFPGTPFFASDTGDQLRKNIPLVSEWNKKRMRTRQDAGYLQPFSIASAICNKNFLDTYEGGPVFIDGSPRSVEEVRNMIDLYCGYAEKHLLVFSLRVSDEECERRMILRNDRAVQRGGTPRTDTATPEARKIKLAFFHTDVIPALALLETLPRCTVIPIDASGEKAYGVQQALYALQRHAV